jgi:predicted dithiol-disulfide oxidoreductase (DUF899 family)
VPYAQISAQLFPISEVSKRIATIASAPLASASSTGVVYHTYSTYARGLDALWGMYQWLDRAPRGRNERRAEGDPLNFFRRHDEYDGD